MNYDYLVVGAGLFGAVFAHEMNKKGLNILVIEKRNHVAGNIYTEDIDGISVHKYGAHIFHTSNKAVWDYVNKFSEFNQYINSPIVKYKEELYNLPFNMNTFSKMWNIATPDEAKKIIKKQIKDLDIKEPKNLEEQALSLVGKDVYEKLIKGYTRKQWGKECIDLPSFIIKRLPVRFTYDNNYFNDRYQGIPIGGYTQLVEKLLEGIEVRLNMDYFEVSKLWDNTKEVTYDKVIFTGMIDKFYDYKFGELEYRSLEFEEINMPECVNYQGNAVVNYTEYEIPYTRIIEHKHFEYKNTKGTIITKEYPQIWNKDKEPYYPVNNKKSDALYNKYRELAENEEQVWFGGRLGQYKYYDMDKVIEAALEMVVSLK